MRLACKQCFRCKGWKSLSLYAKDARRPQSVRSTCKKCTNERRRTQLIPLRYGITWEEREAMLARQDGRCAICLTDEWGAQGPCVDHCHDSLEVRGILCSPCNTGLGGFKDNPFMMMRAVNYLRGKL